ncbi:hypothetical protein HU200_054488 [Digitaria exilis]|uniref:Uncharacterized protein n=1 Tax=Digitaria exilis TaxID=1010633 RepID=A0A835E5K0_9POAL|nr:hypothetical protein HU200_054488 [Digitaria exilis]
MPEPQVVSLGSGKFCVTQFFETMREACSKCLHDRDADKSFAVFNGVEVFRGGGDVGDDQAGDGTELRVIIHKSKRYMLINNTIEFVH